MGDRFVAKLMFCYHHQHTKPKDDNQKKWKSLQTRNPLYPKFTPKQLEVLAMHSIVDPEETENHDGSLPLSQKYWDQEV